MSDMVDNRITVRGIPEDVWHKAKLAALASRKSIGQFITEAIREKLSKAPKKG
jgi:predicted HicB family RNase H-like nuclease